jgi:hypothetical protein
VGVFVNRVLRMIFGLKRDELVGGWRKLHESVIRMTKSRRMGWAGYVALMQEEECI